MIARDIAQAWRFGCPFSYDVGSTSQGFLHIFHVVFAYIAECCFSAVFGSPCHYYFGKGFKALFAGNSGSGAFLRFIWRINVFQFGHGGGLVESFGSLCVKNPGILYRLAYEIAARFQFTLHLKGSFHSPDSHFIHASGQFLTVAADKRHCSPLIQQFDDCHNPLQRESGASRHTLQY